MLISYMPNFTTLLVQLTCEKNKDNRSKVQFHQTTGSRSYEMELINLVSTINWNLAKSYYLIGCKQTA